MLTFIDKYQSILLSAFLIAYIINSIYIGSSILSIILFILVVTIQIIRLRKHIKKLSFTQLLAIFGVILAGLAILVFALMWMNHLISIGIMSFPDWVIIVIQITLILVLLVSVTSIVNNQYLRFSRSKA